MGTLLRDLRYGIRMLLRTPGFTAVVVVTLALGIGANTAMFSVVNAVLLRPLPFKDPGRIIVFQGVSALDFNPFGNRVALWPGWVEKSKTLEDISLYEAGELNLVGAEEAERVTAAAVTGHFFALLGIAPLRGRTFLSQELESGYAAISVISYRLWRERYASDPSAVGRVIHLNGKPFTIVGVMPPAFNFPRQSDVWLPMPMSPEQRIFSTAAILVTQLGRLRPRVTLRQARAELELFARQLSQQRGEKEQPEIELAGLHQHLVQNLRPSLLVLFGAAGLVLLIACANVANLLLARNTGRRRELAIRAAIGAGRGNLMRQLLTESLLLSVSGGGIGLLLGAGGAALARRFTPPAPGLAGDIRLDGWVSLFTFGAAVLTGLLCGFAPALRFSKVNLNEALKEGAPSSWLLGLAAGSRHRLSGILGACEVALALMLLMGAGLLIRSLVNLLQVNPGFRTQNLLTARIDLGGPGYAMPQQRVAFLERVTESLKLLPSVRSAAFTNDVPMGAGLWVAFGCGIEGSSTPKAQNGPMALFMSVSAGYFRTMGIPLLKGRTFNGHDREGATPVVIVSQTMARQFWPSQDPLGKRITKQDPPQWMEVVGVVGDVRTWDPSEEPWAEMYVPIQQEPPQAAFLVVETARAPAALATEVRKAVQSVDKDEPVSSIRSVDELLSQATADPRFRTLLLGIFSGLALLLAVVGIYGIMAYWVSRRTHEIGIRMALGAKGNDVLRMVVWHGMRLTLVGVALGLAGAFALTRLLASLLYGVRPSDPETFAAVSLLVIAAAFVASYVPAWRATRVDPIAALRYE